MDKTPRIFLISACLLLLIGVQLGALGAHALNDVLTPQKLKSWELGVQYQLIHGIGVILIALLYERLGAGKLVTAAGYIMLFGILVFSGSIYLSGLVMPAANAVAPLGGSSLMLAWLLLAIAGWRAR